MPTGILLATVTDLVLQHLITIIFNTQMISCIISNYNGGFQFPKLPQNRKKKNSSHKDGREVRKNLFVREVLLLRFALGFLSVNESQFNYDKNVTLHLKKYTITSSIGQYKLTCCFIQTGWA